MKAIIGRLRRLEIGLDRQKDEQGNRLVQLILERRARRVAQERGVPYEEVLREVVREHQARHEAFMANYDGDGTIADILRYSRRLQCGTALELATKNAEYSR